MKLETQDILINYILEELLGLEGSLSAAYFSRWATMIKDARLADGFRFNERNRRPPRDPVNAMLSFGYALLCKECTVALMAEGLDPWWGLYHRPRHGRPALAPSVANRLMDRMRNRGSALSPREIEVLQLVADGLSNATISKRIHLSQATVKSHLVHIYTKLNVDSRTAAVAAAHQQGLIRRSRPRLEG